VLVGFNPFELKGWQDGADGGGGTGRQSWRHLLLRGWAVRHFQVPWRPMRASDRAGLAGKANTSAILRGP
jgi:hypothetical protein